MRALGCALGRGREGRGGNATTFPAKERTTPPPALAKAPMPLGPKENEGGLPASGFTSTRPLLSGEVRDNGADGDLQISVGGGREAVKIGPTESVPGGKEEA